MFASYNFAKLGLEGLTVAGAAFGPSHEILGELIGDEPVFVNTEIDAHGRHENAVFGFQGTDCDGRKQVL